MNWFKISSFNHTYVTPLFSDIFLANVSGPKCQCFPVAPVFFIISGVVSSNIPQPLFYNQETILELE
nr:MAG TPA: hypothetical protein [Bacteriophage sp.]